MKLPAVALGLAISIPLANAYTGDLTHYTPGLGSCGITNQNGDAIVALSHLIMAFVGNSNNNPICNKQISIHNPTTNTNTIATVTDTCQGCAFGDLDVTPDLFDTIAPNGNGRVHGIEWTPIGWTVPGGSGESESTTGQSSGSSVVQSSSSAAATSPSAALANLPVQEKVAVVVPSAAAATPSESSSTPAAPSSVPAVAPSVAPSAASPSSAPTASAPTSSSASCATAGQSVCSADGTQIGTCTMELTVQFGPVAQGTKCVGGYMVMANSRLRARRV
ncbi:MAG: hypothetical protein ASARMPREDX12_003917 [Alectoria sarmentosa]|nr:MAG: hypothetical protein ASARMPREDX12_003917 [Alectoria sarmentosa]